MYMIGRWEWTLYDAAKFRYEMTMLKFHQSPIRIIQRTLGHNTAYLLIERMDSRYIANHCIRCTLPDMESKFHRGAAKYDIIINRENSIWPQIRDGLESIIQAVFLIDIEFQFHCSTAYGIWHYDTIQVILERIWWRIRFTPHDMYRIKPPAFRIMGNRLLQKIISLPCVNQDSVTFPAGPNRDHIRIM